MSQNATDGGQYCERMGHACSVPGALRSPSVCGPCLEGRARVKLPEGEFGHAFLTDAHADSARLLLAAIPGGIAGSLLAAIITVWLLHGHVAPLTSVIWFAGVALLQVARFAVWERARTRGGLQHDVRRYMFLLRLCAAGAGVAWGAMSLLLFPDGLAYRMLLALLVCAVGGAGIIELSADTIAAALFVVPTAASLAIRMGLSDDPLLHWLVLPAAFNAAYLVLASHRVQGTLRNISAMRVQAAEQAVFDELTGLLNRAGLMIQLRQALERARRRHAQLAVAYMDLNDFKPINDRHGHAAGDMVLRQLAQRWARHVRAGEILARLGGDEFALVIEDQGEQDQHAAVDVVVQRMRAAAEQPFELPSGAEVRIGLTIGVAWSSPSSPRPDPEALLRAADSAMYRGKRRKADSRSWWTGAAGAFISD